MRENELVLRRYTLKYVEEKQNHERANVVNVSIWAVGVKR